MGGSLTGPPGGVGGGGGREKEEGGRGWRRRCESYILQGGAAPGADTWWPTKASCQ